jgi:hypothetical protein
VTLAVEYELLQPWRWVFRNAVRKRMVRRQIKAQLA